jgi:hypothetical protein
MHLADEARSFKIVFAGGDMKITTLVLSILCVALLAACQGGGGGDNRKPTPTPAATPSPTPAKFSKALETPCEGGKLIDSHAYSECGPDGFWHVVQDDYYRCGEEIKAFRVGDTPTMQPCNAKAGKVVPPPSPIGIGYKDFHKDESCQSPNKLDRSITISVCENGYWVQLTYRLYECLDKSLALTDPPDSTLKTEVQCTSPPPAPKH